MKTFLLSIILIFFLTTSKSQITFEKTFGGANTEKGSFSEQTSDGGYIIAASTKSLGAGNTDVYIIKTNPDGDTLWARSFGGNSDDYATCIRQTPDGGYVVSGTTRSFGGGDNDIYLLKLDGAGNLAWSKTLGGTGEDEGSYVAPTSDGGLIIAGSTKSSGSGGFDVLLIKTDGLGNNLWARTFGGNADDLGYCVRNTFDGGFFIAGATNSFGNGGSDAYIIKTDGNGNKQWSTTIGGINNEEARDAEPVGGGYMVIGTTNSYGLGGNDIYLMKTDNSGTLLFTKTFGGPNDDKGTFIKKTIDGGCIIAGNVGSATNSDIEIIKINNAGNMQWSNQFGGSGNDIANCVKQTSDGGYLITGLTGSYGSGDTDVFLIKTKSNGKTGCSYSMIADPIQDSIVISSSFTPSDNITNTNPDMANIPATISGSGGGITTTVCYSYTEPQVVMVMANDSVSIATYDSIGNMMLFRANQAAQMQAKANDISLNVFPNPAAASDINLSVNVQKGNEVLVVVYDMLGKEWYSKVIATENEGVNVFAVDPSGTLPAGVYMITVTSGEMSQSKRLIIK